MKAAGKWADVEILSREWSWYRWAEDLKSNLERFCSKEIRKDSQKTFLRYQNHSSNYLNACDDFWWQMKINKQDFSLETRKLNKQLASVSKSAVLNIKLLLNDFSLPSWASGRRLFQEASLDVINNLCLLDEINLYFVSFFSQARASVFSRAKWMSSW